MLLALTGAVVLGSAASCSSASATSRSDEQSDTELQLGQEVFQELKNKEEIVASSPLYEVLEPIAARITRAAQPRYEHPFRFYLVHQTQPNAFSTPGGNVYVADSLLHFVKNEEELAGTLCHEVAHTIHHDTVALMERRERLARREVGAGVLVGPTPVHLLAIALVGRLNSLGYRSAPLTLSPLVSSPSTGAPRACCTGCVAPHRGAVPPGRCCRRSW